MRGKFPAHPMLFPKPQTVRDPDYLAWLRQQECAICHAPPPSEASHHGPRGMALKADDRGAIPACHPCHARHHQCGRFATMDHLSTEQYRDRLVQLGEVHRQRYERWRQRNGRAE